MKLFTLNEANRMIPTLRPKLERLKFLYSRVGDLRDEARAAAAERESGGGMVEGPTYVTMLCEIGSIVNELSELGVQLKDQSRGLIDFPSLREGRIVLLCWQVGEPEEIQWWHETEAGFAGRQRL